MAYYVLKIAITTILVVAISKIAKRSTFVGALLASVPLVLVLAIFWLYVDTKDIARVSQLASDIFWLVLPSLALFVMLPILLTHGTNFYVAWTVSIATTVGCYWGTVSVLSHYGVEL